MEKNKSRFNTKTPFWYKNLPARAAPLEDASKNASLDGSLIGINDSYLEVSRAATVLRGGFIFFGLAALLMLCVFVPSTVSFFFPPQSLILVGSLLISEISLFYYAVFMIWLDCNIPRDCPARFNRANGKVSVIDYNLSLNPFLRRRVELKIFDWEDIEAELTKQAGFNGKAYVVRYALVLVICKHGSDEVLDRITLKGNEITSQSLDAMWAYIRRFMVEGKSNLPFEIPRIQAISFRRSFFTYMPYFDPSSEGADFRNRMDWFDWIIALLMMWLFWIWLPMGLCHYIAMKCAPEPHWPAEMDVH